MTIEVIRNINKRSGSRALKASQSIEGKNSYSTIVPEMSRGDRVTSVK